MQTFMPHHTFTASAEALDKVRLWNQVNECSAIGKALVLNRGWIHHPATKMWIGYEAALTVYAYACDFEYAKRFNKTNPSFLELADLTQWDQSLEQTLPPWMGDSLFHQTHRANLFRKDPVFYAEFSNEDPDWEYLWPVLSEPPFYTLELSAAGATRVRRGQAIDPRKV